jgi:hypothetical protein
MRGGRALLRLDGSGGQFLVTSRGPAAHIRTMTTLRKEAQDPATAPERLHELIHLAGNRGDGDQDAGWCREYVAANPSAALHTLRELATDQDDTVARFNAARNPSLDADTLRLLAEDRLDFIANAARTRLGLPLRSRPAIRVAGIRLDPTTGRMIR